MSMLGIGWLIAEASVEASEEGGFVANILEANLINLLIVIGVVVYFGRGFLGKILSERRSNIEVALKDAEERRQKAAAALANEQQKLAQAQQEAARIRSAAEERSVAVKATLLAEAEAEVQRMKEGLSQDLNAERERAIADLRQQVSSLALQKAEAELPSRMTDDLQTNIINRSIAMIGGT
ncbi:MAG: ATP synthase F0 subunit B [Leptolyngbya sp.]|nr:MAG: ATP synthase F0 subunit B [Leptolyngbya sp.]